MPAIIAIGGMHRSGTSLITRMLNLSGMYLGPSNRIMTAGEDNPEGFWENLDFVELNDRILACFNGAWDYVPELPEKWHLSPTLQALREDAESLINNFSEQSFWGWKDPRTTLTLEFWQHLIPELKFLFMIRDRLEVAQSLHLRNGFSLINGLQLWEKYNRLVKNVEPKKVLAVHYDALLQDTEKQMIRIFKWAGISLADVNLDAVLSAVKTDLRHAKRQEIEFENKNSFTSVFDLYAQLCEKAQYDPEKERQSGDKKENGKTEKKKTQVSDAPLVSIIIPVFNKMEFTHRCLKAILQNTHYANYEIIFVDNGSTDGTRHYLQKLQRSNIRTVFNEQNLGYVGGCNSGAAVAKGDYLLFLNNDTEVQPGWLLSMVNLAESRSDAGIVGAKLIYPDGKLQEAGGIIFSDGNGWNYGRGFDPADPRFNFVRKVDYVSGAALLVKRALWDRIGGFDERYAPAYYEDTDLCFSVRKEGFQVYYQPESVVVHYEGQTAGTDLASGFKKYQQINRAKFTEKWSKVLQKQKTNDPANVVMASERDIFMNILVADPFLPLWDRSSGSLRLFNYLKLLKEMNAHITFIARVGSGDPKYKQTMQQMGIEVYENDEQALKYARLVLHKVVPAIPYERILNERNFDYAILSFWFLAEYYMTILHKYSPRTRIIVDSVDIHFVREIREAQLNKNHKQEKEILKKKKRELAVYRKADRVWVVTEEDKKHIADKIGKVPIDVVPNVHEPVPYRKQFAKTGDLLFVGNFAHPPNVDAVRFLVKEIFPKIKTRLPRVKLYIVGNNPTPEIQKLNGGDIVVTGFVPDLTPYLLNARVSVNPLRYGAGMKGKIGEALSYGLPVVTTSVGAEGMNLQHGLHALIADDADAFAQEVVRLYEDRMLWEKLSQEGRLLVERRWGPKALKKRLELIFEGERNSGYSRSPDVSIIMLTFNALEYTKKCVRTILDHTQIPYEIIFVDNGSTDGTVDYLKELSKKYPHIHVIFNTHNKGFAYGNNQGARKARGKYVLFLNNDVLVSEGWLENLVQAIELNPRIGMIGPITNSISGLQRVTHVPYNDESGFHAYAAKVRQINRDKITPRRRIAGFCMLMPKKLFTDLKGFDKRFGTGNFEDDDLCLRLRNKKFAIMVHEGVFIHHYGSQTFKANHIEYDQSMQSKARIFFRKWPDVDYEELLELKNPLSEVHTKIKEQIQKSLSSEQTDEVIKLAGKVLLDNPLDVEARFYLALAFYWRGDINLALEEIKMAAKYDEKQPAVWNLMGQIFAAEGRSEDAEKAYKRALTLDKHFIDAHRNYAAMLIEKGEYAEGVNELRKILQENPEDVPTLLYMANLLIEADRPEEAADFARKVLKADVDNELAKKILELSAAMNTPSVFSSKTELKKNSETVAIDDGIQALKAGDAFRALECFKGQLEHDPQNIEALYGTALAFEMQEKFDEAEEILKQILIIDMKFVPAWNDLARIAYSKGYVEKAADLFKKSLDADDTQTEVRNQLSEILFDLQRFDEGIALLLETHQRFPDDLPTIVHLAEVFQQAGKKEEARELWRKALRIDPKNKAAGEALEAMMEEEQKVAEG